MDAPCQPGVAGIDQDLVFHTELSRSRKRSCEAELIVNLLSVHIHAAANLCNSAHFGAVQSLRD